MSKTETLFKYPQELKEEFVKTEDIAFRNGTPRFSSGNLAFHDRGSPNTVSACV